MLNISNVSNVLTISTVLEYYCIMKSKRKIIGGYFKNDIFIVGTIAVD